MLGYQSFIIMTQILPRIQTHEVVHFQKTDARLANNGIPDEVQKLRCRVNYEALKFAPPIQALAEKIEIGRAHV